MSTENPLTDRDVGQLDISIGTSLALEGAMGIYPDREEKPAPIRHYKELWLNVSTMLRNIYGSIDTKAQTFLTSEELLDCLLTEINLIQGIMTDKVGDHFKIVFYYNDLTRLPIKYPNAKIKTPNTERQKIYQDLVDRCIEHLPNYIDEIDYRVFEDKLYGAGDTLIITHRVYDLLSMFQFSKLSLLESHTGIIKDRDRWGSKLGPKDENMPFNIFTLQAFGDRGVDFSPISIKYRRVLDNLSKEKRWTNLTGVEKIKMDIRSLSDSEIKDFLLKLF